MSTDAEIKPVRQRPTLDQALRSIREDLLKLEARCVSEGDDSKASAVHRASEQLSSRVQVEAFVGELLVGEGYDPAERCRRELALCMQEPIGASWDDLLLRVRAATALRQLGSGQRLSGGQADK